MRRLFVSIDTVAMMRESRKEREPDPVTAASIAELAGADGIAIHLRMDKRHIRDRDLYILRETVKTRLDLHIAPNADMVKRALEVKPAGVTLLAERSGELVTEGGLDLREDTAEIESIHEQLSAAGCTVSAIVEPEAEMVRQAAKLGIDGVEIFTRHFTEAKTPADVQSELDRLVKACETAQKNNMAVRIAGGLSYTNAVPILSATSVEELVVGHHIFARAVIVGLERAVREMAELVKYF